MKLRPPSLARTAEREEIRARLSYLSPGDERRWGTMDAPRMLVHITDGLRMALGELPCKPKKAPWARVFPLKQLIVYWFPWPKEAPTARELVARPPGPWEEEMERCLQLLHRFATEDTPSQWPDHPLFGRMDARQWGILGYRHIDHHLRQFGR